jgi:hypothetical protein
MSQTQEVLFETAKMESPSVNVSPVSGVSMRRRTTIHKSQQEALLHSAHLGEKMVGDVLVAAGVTFCVAPFLTVVDKAIVHSAAGSYTLVQSGMESIQGIFRSPAAYFRSPTFLLMWGVYAATYSTANCLKTLAEHQEYSQARRSSASNLDGGKMGIFLGTTAVNTSASLMKDRAYAQMFGSSAVTSSAIPRMSYAFWMARDFSVIGSSFILPDLVSGRLVEEYGMDPKTAQSFSQLACPVAAQFIAGPLHYMGLDLYNRNLGTKSWSEAMIDRSRSLFRGFVPVVAARIARIAPGYGVGGVFNTRLRGAWRDQLINREIKSMMKNPKTPDASRLVELIHGKAKDAKP